MGVVPMDARGGGRDSVLGVIPTERPSCRCGTIRVWSAHAAGNPSDGDRSAEQLVPADRFAREIGPFLKAFPARSRQLNSTVGRGR